MDSQIGGASSLEERSFELNPAPFWNLKSEADMAYDHL